MNQNIDGNTGTVTNNGEAQGVRRYQNPVLVGIILLISGISVAMIQYKVPTIMTNLMGIFRMDAATASWLMSIFTLVSIFVALPAGALAQRFGARRMLVIACGIAVLGSLIGLFSETSPMLIASRAVEGAALTILTTCGPIIVQQNVSPDKVGTSMGIWGIWGCLGSTVAAVLTPTVFGLWGFDGLWIAFAVVSAVAAVLVLIFIRKPQAGSSAVEGLSPDARESQEAGMQGSVPTAPVKPRYRDIFSKDMFLFFGAFVVYNICMLAILAFVPTILQMQGFDPTLSGIISTAPMLLSIISSPLFGVISDKIGRNKPLAHHCYVRYGSLHLLALHANRPPTLGGRLYDGPAWDGWHRSVPFGVYEAAAEPGARVCGHGCSRDLSGRWPVSRHHSSCRCCLVHS